MVKKILPGLSIIAALIAALWFYVQSDDLSRRLRPLVAGPLLEELGPGSSVGDVRAKLFPLSLEVRDIAAPPAKDRPSLAVRRVRIHLNPFALLFKTLSITSLTIQEPTIIVARSREGSIDAQRMIERLMKTAGQGAPSGVAVRIRTIAVKNGALFFRDEGSGMSAGVTRLDCRVSPEPGMVRISSAALTVNDGARHELSGQMLAVADRENDIYVLRSFEWRSTAWRLTASGSIAPETGALSAKGDLQVGQRRGVAGLIGKLRKGAKQGDRLSVAWEAGGTLAAPIVQVSAKVSSFAFGDVVVKSGAVRASYRDGAGKLEGEPLAVVYKGRAVTVRELAAAATVARQGVSITGATVATDDASIHAEGGISRTDGYRLSLRMRSTGAGDAIRALTGAEVRGPAAIDGELTGGLTAPVFDGSLAAGPLVIRGVPFQELAGSLAFRNGTLTVGGMQIRQEQSRYVLDGSADLFGAEPRYRARLRLARSDVASVVALFYEPLPLAITASGEMTFTGTAREFNGRGRLNLEAGSAYGETFSGGFINAELTSSRIAFPAVELRKGGGAVTGNGWIGFDGTYAAEVRSEGVDLSEVKLLEKTELKGPFSMVIRSDGGFSRPRVMAEARSDGLRYRQATLGSAVAKLQIRDGMLSANIGLASLAGDHGAANLNMQLRQGHPWTLNASMDARDVEPAKAAGGGDLWERMRISAALRADMAGEGLRGDRVQGFLTFSRLVLDQGDYHIANEGDVRLQIAEGAITVRQMAMSGTGTRLSVSGSARPGDAADLRITGSANLSLLRVLFREVEHGDGTAVIEAEVRGQWSDPHVAGTLKVMNGQIKIRDIPQKFGMLNGSLSFDRSRVFSDGISGEFGGGTITLSGSANLEGLAPTDFSAKAGIHGVTVRYPPGLTAEVAGTLFFEGDRDARMLSGEIAVNRARYERRVDWKSMLVDFRKGFTQKKKTDIGWIGETRLNVRFTGRESILFESNLAKIPLDVDMLFQGTVNQPQVLGRIEARKGEVYFRKNVFRILYASADFADPNRINPLLDVQAETRVREYDIRLFVSGTADRSTVNFLSDPPLTDSNILALLTLGRTGEELKGKEAGVGVGEATSFMTGKFQDILESRARSLTGLDRFQVDPYISKTDVSVPRVTVGKEVVKDKVYMTYSSNIGAATQEQLFRIEYLLNRNVSLVGERNETGTIGADLKFRFEFR